MTPTPTEQLLYGPEGAKDPLNPFRLERDLIPHRDWRKRYDEMPQAIRDLIDEVEPSLDKLVYIDYHPDWDTQAPFSLGIGFNECVGWFAVAGQGQGPILIWKEGDPYEPPHKETACEFWRRVKGN